jgi:hypothetical protein
MRDVAAAVRALRAAGDHAWEARLLFNRGQLHYERGELDAANRDLRRAGDLYGRLGATEAAADARILLAETARLGGDVVSALRLLESDVDAVEGHLRFNLVSHRARALTQARLLPEARAAAEESARLAAPYDELPQVLLDLAELSSLSAEHETAIALATQAVRLTTRRRQPLAAARARVALARAKLGAGAVDRPCLRNVQRSAALLEVAGWNLEAARGHLVAGRLATELELPAVAHREVELSRPLLARATVADRIGYRYAAATVRLATGDRAGAERLLAASMRLLDDYRGGLGGLELRETSAAIGSDAAQLGLRLAVESARASRILVWSERVRAGALRLPPVRPARDRKLRSLQTELRVVSSQAREARRGGLAARQARLEAAIRARSRTLANSSATNRGRMARRAAAPLLGGAVAVEYVDLDGRLGALTLAGGRVAYDVLPQGRPADELEWLRFALARTARGRFDSAQRTAVIESVSTAAGRIQELLIEPLRSRLRDAPLVIVPTGELYALPWATLPLLGSRPLTIAPSLSAWANLTPPHASRRRKVAVLAGPRLRHARTEIRAVGSLYPHATVLRGREAGVDAALAALDGAAIAHLACHGHFRGDSPLFSSLELADGPLNVYELQRLRRAPELIVLSACDLALSHVHPGDELLGLAAALLALGTRTIIASVVPVPDAEARRIMADFHEQLAAGDSPAVALARAQAGRAVPGFICLGRG